VVSWLFPLLPVRVILHHKIKYLGLYLVPHVLERFVNPVICFEKKLAAGHNEIGLMTLGVSSDLVEYVEKQKYFGFGQGWQWGCLFTHKELSLNIVDNRSRRAEYKFR